ncbi:MAG: NHLP bacteriocin export ABC transporter permease/ATPase subunit [Chitinophagales bacterium]
MQLEKQRVVIEGNKTVFLDDPDVVWQVQKGRVDVFSVRLKDGQPSGRLHHLFRADQGTSLFGIQPEPGQYGLLFKGAPGTELNKLNKNNLRDLCRDEMYRIPVIFFLEQWVIALSEAMIQELPPKTYSILTADDKGEAEAGEFLRAGEDILWVSAASPSMNYLNIQEHGGLGVNRYWPLVHKGWFSCREKLGYQAINTEALIEQGKVWDALDDFHRLIMSLVSLYRSEFHQQEKRNYEARLQNEQDYFEDALGHLAGVVSKTTPGRIIIEPGDRQLLKACRRIGREMGIKFNAPRVINEEIRSLNPLDDICRESRIRNRRVILKEDWWKQDNGPLLAFMTEDNRPVALIPKGTRAYQIYDPGQDDMIDVNAGSNSLLQDFAYTFYRPFPDRALSTKDVIAHGLRSISKKDLTLFFGTGLLGGLINLMIPLAIGLLFSVIVPMAERNQLVWMTAFLLSGALAMMSFQIVRSLALLRLEGRMDASVQAAVWDRVLSLPASFFRDYSAGDLANRALGISDIKQLLSGVVLNTVFTAVFSLLNLVLLFFYDAFLAFLAVLLVAVMSIVISFLGYRLMGYQRGMLKMHGKIAGLAFQLISGIAKFKVAGAEGRAFFLWAREFSQQRKLAFKARSISNLIAVVNASLPLLMTAAIFMAVISSDRVNILPASFLAFNAAFTALVTAIVALSTIITMILNVIPIFERSRVILEANPEVDEAQADPGELSGDLEVSHVSFRYRPDGPLILDDLSFQVKAGEFIAFVGASGGGKSTLIRLLLGFEKPEQGAIYYDNQDLAGLDVASVRRQMGVVLQNDQIMTGNIFENIIGSYNLTMDDAWEAARMSGLEEDIQQMPMGMHTYVTEGARTLSGGQRQRLLIARAIVKKPRIIFFDEATSALDNRTQAIVSESLEKLDATRLVIAHRLSTIINADRIYVIDEGRIVQCGTYEELINQEGIFAQLAKRQIA